MYQQHLLNTAGVHTMRDLYPVLGCYPTSPDGDIALIRSHIAYWSGDATAQRAGVRASRGSTYRVAQHGKHGRDDVIVRITDPYDHREGVRGWK